MASFHRFDMVTTELEFNGETDWRAIEAQMVRLFDEVGVNYRQRRNRSLTVISAALKVAHQVIYKEAQVRAPVIKPHIQAGKQEDRKDIHLGSPKYMIERSAHGKKWLQQGIVARRFVTFKDPVSTYAAAVEYGRDKPFLQVVKKAPFGIQSGDTDYWLRTVAPMEAQPFLGKAQRAKAQQAVNVFGTELSRRWLVVLRRLDRNRGGS